MSRVVNTPSSQSSHLQIKSGPFLLEDMKRAALFRKQKFVRPRSGRRIKGKQLLMSSLESSQVQLCVVTPLQGGGLDWKDQRQPSTGFAFEGIFKPLAWQRDQDNDRCSLATAKDREH